MRRVIAHLDLDAFYASVELLRHPELRGRPVIVCGSGPRAVVTTATYEARAFGVHSAMPAARALRLCPQAVRLPPDFTAYRDASRAVWEIVRAHIEVVEQVGIDEGYLDLSDLVAPKAAVRRLVAEIQARTGLTASVGIGPNKLVAKVASDCEKPRGLVALSREMACERFADAPPGLLPGIGPKTAQRLQALGYPTIAAVRRADVAALVEAFGENLGVHLHRRAHFEDERTLEPVRELKSQSSETTFDEDLDDRPAQERCLDELAAQVCRRLRERSLEGRTIGIKVRLDDWTTITRARTIAQATCDEAVVGDVARQLFAAYDPPRPVRLLGVRMAALATAGSVAPPTPGADAAQLRLGV
jgi:DNA polymerase IV